MICTSIVVFVVAKVGIIKTSFLIYALEYLMLRAVAHLQNAARMDGADLRCYARSREVRAAVAGCRC